MMDVTFLQLRKRIPNYDVIASIHISFFDLFKSNYITRFPCMAISPDLSVQKSNKKLSCVETVVLYSKMALSPLVFPYSMPVPFLNEMFVLARDGVDFEVDKIPGAQRGHDKAKGISYLSNIRMVFVANKPGRDFAAFDLPLLSKDDTPTDLCSEDDSHYHVLSII
ncbi:uncharacterized protein [Coffea arabica]